MIWINSGSVFLTKDSNFIKYIHKYKPSVPPRNVFILLLSSFCLLLLPKTNKEALFNCYGFVHCKIPIIFTFNQNLSNTSRVKCKWSITIWCEIMPFRWTVPIIMYVVLTLKYLRCFLACVSMLHVWVRRHCWPKLDNHDYFILKKKKKILGSVYLKVIHFMPNCDSPFTVESRNVT